MREREFWSGTTTLGIPQVEQAVVDGAQAALGRLYRSTNAIEFSRPRNDGFGTAEVPAAVMRANWTPPAGRASSTCDVAMYDRDEGLHVVLAVGAVGGGGPNAKKMAKLIRERLREADPGLQ